MEISRCVCNICLAPSQQLCSLIKRSERYRISISLHCGLRFASWVWRSETRPSEEWRVLQCSRFSRKDRPPERHVPARRHELRPAGVCHPLHTRNQRAHAGGDLQRAGQEVSHDPSWPHGPVFLSQMIWLLWNVYCLVILHRKPFKVPLFGKRKPPSGAQQGLMNDHGGSSSTSKEIPAGLRWQDAAAQLSP